MKFRYYISDLGNGNVAGTDSEQTARDFAQSEEYFVVDAKTGLWLTNDLDVEIKDIAAG